MGYYLRKYLLSLCLGDCVTNFASVQLFTVQTLLSIICVHEEVNICVKYLMKVCSLRSLGIFSSAALRRDTSCDQWRDKIIYVQVSPCPLQCEHPLWQPAAMLAQQIIRQTDYFMRFHGSTNLTVAIATGGAKLRQQRILLVCCSSSWMQSTC